MRSADLQPQPAHEVTARQVGLNAGSARNPSIFNLHFAIFNLQWRLFFGKPTVGWSYCKLKIANLKLQI